jgi:hypothetical protein
MTEVTEFLSANPLIGSALGDFSTHYEKLSDVWSNCYRPDWMLELLKRSSDQKRDYQHADALEKYIESLRERMEDNCDQLTQDVECDFRYRQGVRHIQHEVESGKFSVFEGQRRSFIWLWLTAYEATRYFFEDKIDRFHFNRFAEQIIAEDTAIGTTPNDSDEIELKRNVFNMQADLLRATVGNPF